MGQWAVSARPGEVISCVGIGSCIALVLTDLRRGVVGVAHVVMPDGDGDPPAKFATTVVPELTERIVAAGAWRSQLRAAIVGGAAMFNFSSAAPEDLIGARNERLVREHLELARIPLVSVETGGTSGRSLRVIAGDPVIATVRGRTVPDLALALDGRAVAVGWSGLPAGTGASSPKQTFTTTSEMVN